MNIRAYKPDDYKQLVELYKQGELYGGQFDQDRDSEDRIAQRVKDDKDAILIAEQDGELVGTLSIIEDARVAWLFRFAVKDNEAAAQLYAAAVELLRQRGHKQILVYSPTDDEQLDKRYKSLGFTQGGNYTCYATNI